MATYDERGNVVVDPWPNRPRPLGLAPGETAGIPDNYSFGSSLYEFLNPWDVQQAMRDAGVPESAIPSTWDIMSGAVEDTGGYIRRAREQAAQLALDAGAGAVKVSSNLAILAGVVLVIFAVSEVQGERKLARASRPTKRRKEK